MGELLDCLREKDEDGFHRWTKCEAWATVEQLMEANGIIIYQHSAFTLVATILAGFSVYEPLFGCG